MICTETSCRYRQFLVKKFIIVKYHPKIKHFLTAEEKRE